MKPKFYLAGILVALLSVSMFVYATSYPGDLTDKWISRGSIQPYTYIVEQYNSTFYGAINHTGYGTSANEGYEFLSTNASYLLMQTLGSLSTSGGSVFVRAGHYDLDSPVYFYNSTDIVGENMYSTVLHMNTNNTNLFRPAVLTDRTRGLRIANLEMYGVSGSLGNAIEGNFWECTFENLVSDYWYTHICMLNFTTDGTWDNHLFKLWFDHSTSDGIYMGDYETDNVLNDVHVQHAGSSSGLVCAALHIYSSGSHRITDCVFDVSHYGIWLQDGSARIKGTSIDQSHSHGVYLQGHCTVTTFQGCKIRDWGNSGGNCSGIYMEGTGTGDSDNVRDILIEGNWFDANAIGEYDIGFASYDGAERDITITGNDFRFSAIGAGHWIRALSCYPYSSRVQDNEAYTTMNSGNEATCINGTAIAHGLVGSPATVSLTMFGQNYINSTCWYLDPSVYSMNATHIVICFTIFNAGTITAVSAPNSRTIYWIAEYKP